MVAWEAQSMRELFISSHSRREFFHSSLSLFPAFEGRLDQRLILFLLFSFHRPLQRLSLSVSEQIMPRHSWFPWQIGLL